MGGAQKTPRWSVGPLSCLPHAPSGAGQLGPGGGSAPGPSPWACCRALRCGSAAGWAASSHCSLRPLVLLLPAPHLLPGQAPGPGVGGLGLGRGLGAQAEGVKNGKEKSKSFSLRPTSRHLVGSVSSTWGPGSSRPCCTGGSGAGWAGQGRGPPRTPPALPAPRGRWGARVSPLLPLSLVRAEVRQREPARHVPSDTAQLRGG